MAASINVTPASFGFRHQLLKGMRNRELAAKAADDNISLGELIPIAARKEQREASEAASKSSEPWRVATSEQPAVAAVTEYRKAGMKRPASKEQWGGDRYGKAKQCKYCGQQQQHASKNDCPAFGKICRKCGKSNHFSKVCESKEKVPKVSAIDAAEDSADAKVRSQDRIVM